MYLYVNKYNNCTQLLYLTQESYWLSLDAHVLLTEYQYTQIAITFVGKVMEIQYLMIS